LSREESIAPENCPLCGNNNYCGNLSSVDNSKACWCTDIKMTFPDSLLNQVPDPDKNRACICKACALGHKADEFFFEVEGCYITELSNSPADPEVSIAQARVTKGVTTAWHKLESTYERYFILSGSGVVEVGNLPARSVSPGDVIVIPPMERQRITNNGIEDLIFLAICTPRFQPHNYKHAE